MAAVASRRLTELAVVGCLVANMIAEPLRALRDWRDTDFVVFASAARMVAARANCLYCAASQRSAEGAYLGIALPPGAVQPFVNPPAAAWMMQPFAALPPEAALATFLAGALACMIAACAVAVRLLVPQLGHIFGILVVIAAVASLPAASGLALGQWGPYIVLPVMLAVAWLDQCPRRVIIGILLSVGLVKPQLLFLVPLGLVVSQAWRPLIGLACGAVVWTGTSIALLGAHTLDWPALAVGSSSAAASEYVGLPGVAALFTGSSVAGTLVAVALAVAIAAAALVHRNRLRDPAAATALAVAASLLIAPHVNGDDFILMAPLLVLWARRQPGLAVGAGMALSVAWLVDAMVGSPGGAHALTIGGLVIFFGAARSLLSGSLTVKPEALAAAPAAS